MAVSPSDFELYSRVTGRPVPTDRGARMKMAPEVNRFIKSREYERPQKTALQKGADFLGKAALLGGALAAGHAIGGGFRGPAAEKVAEVVENMAKTGDVGAEGGKVVQNVANAATGMATYPNEIYGALQQEEMLNNLAQDTVLPAQPEGSAQIESPRQKVDSWLATNAAKYRLSGEETGQLLDEARQANAIASEGSDIAPPTLYDANVENYPLNYEGERRNVWGMPEYTWETKAKKSKLSSEDKRRLSGGLDSAQRQARYSDTGQYPNEMDDMWENRMLDAMARDIDPPSDGGGGGGGSLAPIAPDEGGFRGPYVRDDQLATTSDSNIQQKVGEFLGGQRQWGINTLDAISRQGGGRDLRQSAPALGGAIAGRGLIPGTGGGLLPGSGTSLGQNAVSGFWDAAGNLARRDPMIGGAARGLEGIGNINVFGNSVGDAVGNAFGAVPGLNEAVNLGGVKIAELGGLGLGTVADSAVKDTLKLGVDARRFAENRFGFRPLSWQETAVQTGDLIDQGWARDEAAKIAARNNPLLAEGMGRHDEAISSLQKNIQAVLPTTRPTGQVAIGENAQLNRHPDVPPGETDMAPSRLIQQFSDKGLLGGSSLTPDDLEIRTDVDVRDPVNFTQLFGKRMGRGEKANFVAGLQERNKDIYSGASDLPARKVGGRGKIGTSGEAATMAGKLEYPSRDAQDPLHGVKQFAAGLMEEPDLSDKAAEEVGRRMAEREQQGNLFEDDKEQQQGSTEWVRSPDGKLRRKKIDDPWDS